MSAQRAQETNIANHTISFSIISTGLLRIIRLKIHPSYRSYIHGIIASLLLPFSTRLCFIYLANYQAHKQQQALILQLIVGPRNMMHTFFPGFYDWHSHYAQQFLYVMLGWIFLHDNAMQHFFMTHKRKLYMKISG